MSRISEEYSSLVSAVRLRLNGQLRDFRVCVRDDGLILQGRATTFHAKQLAQHLVMQISGLSIHANEIEVSGSL